MKDKVILITGGTKGIGDAISSVMLTENNKVVVIAKNKENNRRWLEEKYRQGYKNVYVYNCDVSDYDQCKITIK